MNIVLRRIPICILYYRKGIGEESEEEVRGAGSRGVSAQELLCPGLGSKNFYRANHHFFFKLRNRYFQ